MTVKRNFKKMETSENRIASRIVSGAAYHPTTVALCFNGDALPHKGNIHYNEYF